MHRKLPPLNALRAFEATARHLSFTRAAQELGVTQGAISRQVSLLEDYLGLRLLERSGKQVALLPAAEMYFNHLATAFDMIAGATDGISGASTAESLTVNILPSLSNRWLIPLLEQFRRAHPRYGVRLAVGDGPIDFAMSDADIAIRAAKRNDWKRLHAEAIMGEELLPVASPALLLAHPVTAPADFMRLALLQHTSRADMWRDYLESMGVKNPKVKHDLGFEHFFMLIQAATDGLGAALIPRFLITRELKEGSLKVAYTKKFKSPYRYYLICPKPTLELKKVRLFRNWLLGTIKDAA